MDKIRSLLRIALKHWVFDLLVVAMVAFSALVATGTISSQSYQQSFAYLSDESYSLDFLVSDNHVQNHPNPLGVGPSILDVKDDGYYKSYLLANSISYSPVYSLMMSGDGYAFFKAVVGDGNLLRRYHAPIKHGSYFPGDAPLEVVLPYQGPGKTPAIGSLFPLQYSIYSPVTHQPVVVFFHHAIIVGYSGQHEFLGITGYPVFAINDPNLFAAFAKIMEDPSQQFSRQTTYYYPDGTPLVSTDGYTRSERYFFQLSEGKAQEFKILYSAHQADYPNAGQTQEDVVHPDCQSVYSAHQEYSTFASDGIVFYLQFLLIAFSILGVGGRLAFATEDNRRLIAVYLLSGCSRRMAYGAMVSKGILDTIFAMALSLVLLFVFDYGYLSLGNALYVIFEKGWFTILVVFGFYAVFSLSDYLSLRGVSIAKDLRREF